MALIEDYGLVGDLQGAALVSREGSVDWLCLPRFDSGALFAGLLGDEENGHWTIQPAGEFRPAGRQYRGDTLVLETDLETDDGAVRLIDFMPPRETNPDLVRIVEGVRGRVEMRMELVIRFDYGSIVPGYARSTERCSRSPAQTQCSCALRSSTRVAISAPSRRSPSPKATASRSSCAGFPPTRLRPSRSSPKRRSRPRSPSGRTGQRSARTKVVGTRRCTARCSRSRRSRSLLPAASSPLRRRRCRSGSGVSGTGTTATAGSATPHSPCSPSCVPATSRRPARGATGCSVRSQAHRTTSRSCTASRASGDSPSSSFPGSPATRARSRFASATAHPTSASSTSTARSSTRSTSRAARVWQPRTTRGA